MSVVIDASALLAFLFEETGAEIVDAALTGSCMSSVNWSEVIQHLLKRGLETDGCREELELLGLRIIPFDAIVAEEAAKLWPQTRTYVLSLGDRACIALGMAFKTSILTADRLWPQAFPDLAIQLIR